MKRGLFAFIDHPRARVNYEERGRWFPGWLLRRIYRPLISSTENTFRAAIQKHEQRSTGGLDAWQDGWGKRASLASKFLGSLAPALRLEIAMYNTEGPVFPEYVDDAYFHVSTITLPGFAGMQITNGPYGAITSPEPSISVHEDEA